MVRLTRNFAPGIAVFMPALMLVCATGTPAAASQAVAAPSPSKAPPSGPVSTSASLTPLTDGDLEVVKRGCVLCIWRWAKIIIKYIQWLCKYIQDQWKNNQPQIPQPYEAAVDGDDGCYGVDEHVTVDLYGLDPEECVEPDTPEVDDVVVAGPDPSECGE